MPYLFIAVLQLALYLVAANVRQIHRDSKPLAALTVVSIAAVQGFIFYSLQNM